MKELFLTIRTKLLSLSAFKFVDLEKGQLDIPDEMGRYPVNYPCALLSVQLPQTKNVTTRGEVQQANAILNVRLAWDFTGNTAGQVTPAVLSQSLAYFDVVEDVWNLLQGFQDVAKTFNRLERISQREETRGDGLKVVNVTFRTSYREQVPSQA
ncbi:MAG: hypothetical protein RIC03_06910 [Cyclobacteriaceae bacterium]